MAFAFQLNAQNASVSDRGLPQNAQDFITQYFSGKQISKSKSEVKNGVSKHKITFDDRSKIEFFGDGTWKEVKAPRGEALPDGMIPEKILAYIQKNYPNQKVTEIEKESTKYEVKLTNRIELEFDLDQNFLRID